MKAEDLQVRHIYRGTCADSDKTRLILAIIGDRVETRVYRDGVDLGTSTISLRTMAMWAAEDVTYHE